MAQKLATDVPLSQKPSRTWDDSHGKYLAGRAVLDELDTLAAELELKWGAGRLRLLVPAQMREAFDRQRYKVNGAINHGDLETVRQEGGRMILAWRTLDRVATEAGAKVLADVAPQVMEIPAKDGTVIALVPHMGLASGYPQEGRKVAIWTYDEIGEVLSECAMISQCKVTWPGAQVVRVRQTVPDPVSNIVDTEGSIDDEIPF